MPAIRYLTLTCTDHMGLSIQATHLLVLYVNYAELSEMLNLEKKKNICPLSLRNTELK